MTMDGPPPTTSNEGVDDSTTNDAFVLSADTIGIISANNNITADDVSPSAASSSAVGDDESSGMPNAAKQKFTLPEPPQWRFVNRAKKTEGYSSSAAGKFIGGRSGEELAGKYVAPVTNTSRRVKSDDIVHAGGYEWEDKVGGKEERDVGKLGRMNCTEGDEVLYERAGKKVADEKVDLRQGVNDDDRHEEQAVAVVEEEPCLVELTPSEGEVLADEPMLLDEKIEVPPCVNDDQDEEQAVAVVEEEPCLEESTPLEREVLADEPMLLDEKIDVPLSANDDQDEEQAVAVAEEAPCLEESTPLEREVLAEEPMLHLPVLVPHPALLTSHRPEEEEPVLTKASPAAEDGPWDWLEIQVSETEPTSAAPRLSPSSESPVPSSVKDTPQRSRKESGALLLLLLLIFLIAIILGVVLGREKPENENASNEALGAEGTDIPSQSPAAYCPFNTTLFSIEYTSVKEENTWNNSYPKTWVLKYACSDVEIIRCLPCADTGNTSLAASSSQSSQVSFDNNLTNDPTTSATVMPVAGLEKYTTSSDGVSGCIPNGYAYAFEVKPSDNPEECCGFLPYSFLMSYDDVALISDSIVLYEFEGTIQGGGRVSFPESAEPCPTSEPSGMPSATPSEIPSPYPTTQPTGYPSGSPTLSPSDSPTPRPSDSPTPRPSVAPSNRPTPNPSAQPMTQTPTDKPACDANYEDFNLCIAIDMSGSVCNKGTGFGCDACEPELICYDSDVDRATCCNDFSYVIEFTKDMIGAFGSFVAERSFSIVPFATNAELANDLSTMTEALNSLDALTYTGGMTNHAAAIDLCRSSLESSPEDRKKFLLLITDGSPSVPEGSPEAEAEAAAEEAKSEGIFIIPVMIKQEVSAYLQRISSDGTVFDASDFVDLASLQETLLAQVECQA